MKQHITNTALALVKESGLINLSRAELCERAGIADGSFPHLMGCTFTEFVSQLKKMIDPSPNNVAHIVYKSRTDPTLRKDQILKSAVEVAKTKGYNKMTRDQIADEAGVSMGLVTRYFETMTQLRRAVLRYAVSNDVYEILAQAIINRDPITAKLPPDVKNKALQHLTEV